MTKLVVAFPNFANAPKNTGNIRKRSKMRLLALVVKLRQLGVTNKRICKQICNDTLELLATKIVPFYKTYFYNEDRIL
jgi:hypothetical protein